MFLQYLKRIRFVLLWSLLCAGILFLIFVLEEINLKAAVYPTVLCLAIGLLILLCGYLRYKKTGQKLEHLLQGEGPYEDSLPIAQDGIESEYQELIIKNAQALSKGLMDSRVKIVSGGTDNHLMLVDLRGEDVTCKELEKRLDAAHITCNKNTVPNDPRSPFVTSGGRLGTPAVTTRGLKEEDMDVIAECIALVLQSEDNIEKVKGMVAELTAKYPLDM